MRKATHCPLIDALRRPELLAELSPASWDLLVRQARRTGLLGRIAYLAQQKGFEEVLPDAPRAQLRSARTLVAAQQREVLREVGHVLDALRPLGVQVVLLKGAAYVLSGSVAASGRLFSDVDILVPKARLAEVESALMLNGWATTHHSAYDQRYYRQWMHELPPMQHLHRHTVLDVHHAILPQTARAKPPTPLLQSAALPIESIGGAQVLAPVDAVLHSVAHLIYNEELSRGLRDLSDLDLLLRHWGETSGFWQRLIQRSTELGLARPLYYALRTAQFVLGTPVPAAVVGESERAAPPWPVSLLMDGLWRHGLGLPGADSASPLREASLFLLYIRAHWLRMPPALLFRHLLIKATEPVKQAMARA